MNENSGKPTGTDPLCVPPVDVRIDAEQGGHKLALRALTAIRPIWNLAIVKAEVLQGILW